MTCGHAFYGFYSAVSGIALGLWFLLSGMSGMQGQIWFLAFFVAIIGLPHGALDTALARKAGYMRDLPASVFFIAMYVALAAAAFSLWLLYPAVLFCAFIAMSLWHFSDDFRAIWKGVGAYLLAAAMIILPAAFHADMLQMIIALLSTDAFATFYTDLAHKALWPVGAVMAAAFFKTALNGDFRAFCFLLLYCVSGLFLPPLLFFLIYFCALHSLRHYESMRQILDCSYPALIKKTLAPTFILIAAAVLLLSGYQSGQITDLMLQIIFIGLFSLTVPHMLLIFMSARAGSYEPLK